MDESTISQYPGNPKDIDESFENIDLIALIEKVWKHKYLILAGSFIPSIIIVLIIHFSPSNFRTEYLYSNIFTNKKFTNASKLEVFVNDFYSRGNINRIVGELNEAGLESYGSLLNNARNRNRKSLESLVSFKIWPPATGVTKAGIDQEDMEYLSVKMTITAPEMQNEMVKIAKVLRDCFEKLIVLSDLDRELFVGVNDTRLNMAAIEKDTTEWDANLKALISFGEKLKELDNKYPSVENSDISLQYNVSQSKFLPFYIQIRGNASDIVSAKSKISEYNEDLEYYEALIALCNVLSSEIGKHKSSDYSIQDFQVYVIKLAESKSGTRLGDYLISYLRRLENRIQSSVPLTESPEVEVLSKGTVKKSGLVFVILFGVFTVIALVRDSLRCRRKAS